MEAGAVGCSGEGCETAGCIREGHSAVGSTSNSRGCDRVRGCNIEKWNIYTGGILGLNSVRGH